MHVTNRELLLFQVQLTFKLQVPLTMVWRSLTVNDCHLTVLILDIEY